MNLKNLIICFVVFYSCNPPSEKTVEDTNETIVEMSRLEEEHQLEKAGYADSVNLGLIEDTYTGSARRESSGKVGEVEVTINHGSPGTRGRVIWNGLVSYDQIWVSGSHWATAVTFSKDVEISGKAVPAGTYAFFTIPGREKWTLILNENYDQHLAEEYKEEEDIVRLTVKPEELEDTVQRLTYTVESLSGDQGVITLSWDKIKVEMPFKIP